MKKDAERQEGSGEGGDAVLSGPSEARFLLCENDQGIVQSNIFSKPWEEPGVAPLS